MWSLNVIKLWIATEVLKGSVFHLHDKLFDILLFSHNITVIVLSKQIRSLSCHTVNLHMRLHNINVNSLQTWFNIALLLSKTWFKSGQLRSLGKRDKTGFCTPVDLRMCLTTVYRSRELATGCHFYWILVTICLRSVLGNVIRWYSITLRWVTPQIVHHALTEVDTFVFGSR